MADIYSNLNPKVATHIDERLRSVDTYSSLPDPNNQVNFLYPGASIFVTDENAYYKCVQTQSGLAWSPFQSNELGWTQIAITPQTTILDLSNTDIDINDSHTVLINVVGSGNHATIQSIQNFPNTDREITFHVAVGKKVTFKHTGYDTAVPTQFVSEIGTDLTLHGRAVGNEALMLKNNNGVLCQWGAVQYVTLSDFIAGINPTTVIDDLVTTNPNVALSANQGNVLWNLLQGKQNTLLAGSGISLSDNPNNTTTISSIPASYVDIGLPLPNSVIIGTIPDYLVTLVSGINKTQHRLVDWRAVNQGLWLCSAGKNPASVSSWLQLDARSQAPRSMQIHYQPGVGNNLLKPKLDLINQIGDLGYLITGGTFGINSTHPDDGGVFRVPTTGTYEFQYDLIVDREQGDANRWPYMVTGQLFRADGVDSNGDLISPVELKSFSAYSPGGSSKFTLDLKTSIILPFTNLSFKPWLGVRLIGYEATFPDSGNTGSFTGDFELSPMSTVKITKLK